MSAPIIPLTLESNDLKTTLYKSNKHLQSLLHHLNLQRKQKQNTDLIFSTHVNQKLDSGVFHCHRNIVSNFSKLVEREDQKIQINFPEFVEGKFIDIVLDFIYTGKLRVGNIKKLRYFKSIFRSDIKK